MSGLLDMLIPIFSRSVVAQILFHCLQYEKVLKFISTAKNEGATILSGGARPEVFAAAAAAAACY